MKYRINGREKARKMLGAENTFVSIADEFCEKRKHDGSRGMDTRNGEALRIPAIGPQLTRFRTVREESRMGIGCGAEGAETLWESQEVMSTQTPCAH